MLIGSPQLLITLDCLVMIFQIKILWRKFLLLFLRGLNPKSPLLKNQKFRHYLLGQADECSPNTKQRRSMRQKKVTEGAFYVQRKNSGKGKQQSS